MKDDTISRQAAILAIKTRQWLTEGAKEALADQLERLPSAQPERKRGEWEFYEDRSPVWDIAGEKTWARVYKCSECGFVHAVIEDFGIYQYCPQCGADMREDNHETD